MSEETKEDEEEKEEEKKDDSEDASLACAELLRLALLSKDLTALSKATNDETFRRRGSETVAKRRGGVSRDFDAHDEEYQQQHAIRCSVIVLVFSMNNCQPCVQFAPKLDRLAKEYKDLHVGFVKCNIHESDMNRRLANEAGVFGFPCAQMYDGHTGQKVQLEGGDVKGANEAKLREGLETHAYNVEKFERLKRDAFEALSEAKAKIFCGEDDDEQEQQQQQQQQRFVTLVKTVTAYASNAIEKEDAKYRRIKTSGKAFTERVKSVGDEGEKCLRAFGFEKKKDDDDDEEEVYEISPVVFDEFDENNKFGKREMRRVIKMLRALTG